MAFAQYTWWEVQTGGSDTNGGGFDTQNANGFTDLVATVANTASPVVTSASYTFVAGDVGAFLYIKSGTNWLSGWYQIASVSAGAATLSAAIGAASVFFTNTAGKAFNRISLNKVVGCASVASPTAGTWAIDYSQQASPQFVYTDLVIGATTTQATSVAHPFDKHMVGNIINITSGTGFTVQRVQIVSVSTITATFDKSLGTAASTGGNGKLGGCLLSVAIAASLMPLSNTASHGVFQKSGSYTMSVNSSNVASGKITLPGSVDGSNQGFWEGYGSVRGDNAVGTTRPKITCSGITVVVVNIHDSFFRVENVEIDCANGTNTFGINFNAAIGYARNCKIDNPSNVGFSTSTQYGVALVDCEVSGGSVSTGGFSGYAHYFNCYAHGITGAGFGSVGGSFYGCCASGCTTGFTTANGGTFVDCLAYNCTNGYSCSNSSSGVGFMINCMATNNSARGWSAAAGANTPMEWTLINCAGYSNATADYDTGFNNVINFQSCSVSPFVSAGTNFALNSTAGGGALLRAAGWPSTLAGLSTTLMYPDIGLAQHQDSGGGASQTAYAFVE